MMTYFKFMNEEAFEAFKASMHKITISTFMNRVLTSKLDAGYLLKFETERDFTEDGKLVYLTQINRYKVCKVTKRKLNGTQTNIFIDYKHKMVYYTSRHNSKTNTYLVDDDFDKVMTFIKPILSYRINGVDHV